ncbi:nucleophile aminohydrolase [Podospora australis]|uniref:Nucleophile aminohydrolase n=1 Tax=Podospora australis TaxID=1536484 RepID=A0AAN7AK64_9PEZI|nr:nucleophile aminohydrolase [Podospora australis]
MFRGSSSPDLSAGDGTVDRMWRRGSKPPVAAIFIHAGAGYHSIANERVHLEACSDAARVGMRFLKAGATAAEAVEAAIICLEDKEITNAGFGSNLNMDGVVECDATVVDHKGRSGACGAVPGVKNPISLAKMILDSSSKPLSLRRVPPNILVGLGAKEFAEEHGMQTILNDYLISKNAKDRYNRWKDDLRRAEAKLTSALNYNCKYPEGEPRKTSPGDYENAASLSGQASRRDHTSAILTGTWNEGQPDSPYNSGSPLGENGSPTSTPLSSTPRSTPSGSSRPAMSLNRSTKKNPLSYVSAAFQTRTRTPKRPKVQKSLSDDTPYLSPQTGTGQNPSPSAYPHDGSVSDDNTVKEDEFASYQETYGFDAAHDQYESEAIPGHRGAKRRREEEEDDDGYDEDLITDTVGAIAIDLKGRIAAGSSSGGIGMKHQGRIGPAALVGVGTAVVPEDPNDELSTTVAAVTSGTGEHMATSIASAKCAERLYHNTRRGPGGRDVEELDEHNILDSFILDDFMGHPGVRNQPSAGAIGVMSVKKDRTGIYFYFAHNTDSFALASMSSSEREPLCVMSRLGNSSTVAQGGRRVRLD